MSFQSLEYFLKVLNLCLDLHFFIPNKKRFEYTILTMHTYFLCRYQIAPFCICWSIWYREIPIYTDVPRMIIFTRTHYMVTNLCYFMLRPVLSHFAFDTIWLFSWLSRGVTQYRESFEALSRNFKGYDIVCRNHIFRSLL